MNNHDVYCRSKKKALKKIRQIRNVYALRFEEKEVEIRNFFDSAIFDIGGKDHREYQFVMHEVEKYSNEMFSEILSDLLHKYRVNATMMGRHMVPSNLELSIIIDEGRKRTLYLFKKIGIQDCLDDNMLTSLLNIHRATDYKYITMAHDDAFKGVFNHNNDENNQSRGTNIFSIKYFFERFFGPDEYL